MKSEFFEPHRKNISKLCDIDFNFTTEPPVKEEFKELHPEPLDPHVEMRYKKYSRSQVKLKEKEKDHHSTILIKNGYLNNISNMI